ncbi:phosphotransferase family protein [Tardiphaga sp.]|uniref:phosphotransferase family protein n=1 Tax=Tardiphaga sp. TaxID=1926292 RepID=UPI0026049A25|nr:phosphotransferase family protein [Tardiphaga sp.]MDB5618865.1 phosphotransferase family protein [Tardiphaga sp.]
MTATTTEALLARSVVSWCAGAAGVNNAVQLSGGASQETWSFDIAHPDGVIGAILRRAPSGCGAAPGRACGLVTEAALIRCAHRAGVPVPVVLHVLDDSDGLGVGFIMQRIAGETIPRKILRDAEFAAVRPGLAHQAGRILADIHGLPLCDLPELRRMTAAVEIDELAHDIADFGWPRPVFQLALRWLRDHDPGPSERITLVHGDFRHGNLMIGPDGIRAVLDWELAHLGDPMEDLGWICVNSWRFGEIDRPVGGFGLREDQFAGYEAASGLTVDVMRVKFWEVMGTLRWGVMCCGMMQRFRDGPDRSLERAMIGRRSSETEIDLLRLLAPRG